MHFKEFYHHRSALNTYTMDLYSRKKANYFGGIRKDFIDFLPVSPNARLLEIGCGTGDTAHYGLTTNKCGWCAGVELCEEPGNEAKKKLDQVIIGNIEELDLPFKEEQFDILILSEILEHLYNPRNVLRKLNRFLRPGAHVVAGTPNVAYWRIVSMILRGNWSYSDCGIMDDTHIRWFTPLSLKELFESTGYTVTSVEPARPLEWKAKITGLLMLGMGNHLLHPQIVLKAIRN